MLANKTNAQQQSSVRWKEQVEELVFDHHPNEHASDTEDETDEDEDINDDSWDEADQRRHTIPWLQHQNNEPSVRSTSSMLSASSVKRKKAKPRIVIDSAELESHLRHMDTEAKSHFVQDFWDNFEESLDGILSIVDTFGEAHTRASQSVLRRQRLAKQQDRQSHVADSESENDSIRKNTSSIADDERVTNRANSFPAPAQRESSSVATLMSSPSMKSAGFTSALTQPIPITPDAGSRLLQSTNSGLVDESNSWHEHQGTAIVSPPEQMENQGFAVESPISSVVSAKILPSSSDYSQTLFRPISPNFSVASAIKSVTDGSVQSDLFDLESLAMSELDNPFRQQSATAPQAAPTSPPQPLLQPDNFLGLENHTSQPALVPQDESYPDPEVYPDPELSSASSATTTPEHPDKSFDSSNTKMTANTSKGKRFNISVVSNPSETAARKPQATIVDDSTRASNVGKGGSLDDVFDGLDTVQPQFVMAEPRGSTNERVEHISLRRTLSSASSACMSDLSESVLSDLRNVTTGLADEPCAKKTSTFDRSGAAIPASQTTTSKLYSPMGSPISSSRQTQMSSPMSSSRQTRMSSSTFSSARSDPLSAMDLMTSSLGEGTSVHTVETAVEANGFFEYFTAYVSAIVTECTALGDAGRGFHQDLIGLFSDESSVYFETREPPASPPSPTSSSVTSVTSASQ
jgi:hypothetical protein